MAVAGTRQRRPENAPPSSWAPITASLAHAEPESPGGLGTLTISAGSDVGINWARALAMAFSTASSTASRPRPECLAEQLVGVRGDLHTAR